jgi:iron-sulfur cluster assembly protein
MLQGFPAIRPNGTGLALLLKTLTERPMTIQLTPKAAKAIQRFIKFSETPVIGMRVSVSGGGCSGYQYGLKLEATPAADDAVLEVDGIKMLVDPDTRPLVDGLVIDFIDTMTESGFKFENPNAKAACGCGKSFSF